MSQRLAAEPFKVAKSTITRIWRDQEKHVSSYVNFGVNPQQFAKRHCLFCKPVFSELTKTCGL